MGCSDGASSLVAVRTGARMRGRRFVWGSRGGAKSRLKAGCSQDWLPHKWLGISGLGGFWGCVRRVFGNGTGLFRDQEGHPRQEAAQSKESRQESGKRWSARGQQDGSSRRHAPAEKRRYPFRDHGQNGLAEAYCPRLHGRRDVEGRLHRRVLQARERRADLPHQRVASNPSFRPPGSGRGGLFSLVSIPYAPCQITAVLANKPSPRRPNEREPTVAQRRPILSAVAAAEAPRTNRQELGTALRCLDARPGSRFPEPRSPGGNGRFMTPPSVPPRSPRMCARRRRAWPSSRTGSASAGQLRPRISGPTRCPGRRAR